MYVAKSALALEGCLVSFNYALGQRGGGIFAELASMVNVSSSHFRGNIGLNGGGIAMRGASLLGVTAGVQLESNTAAQGAGIFAEGDSTVQIDGGDGGVEFVNNNADKSFMEDPDEWSAPITGAATMMFG